MAIDNAMNFITNAGGTQAAAGGSSRCYGSKLARRLGATSFPSRSKETLELNMLLIYNLLKQHNYAILPDMSVLLEAAFLEYFLDSKCVRHLLILSFLLLP